MKYKIIFFLFIGICYSLDKLKIQSRKKLKEYIGNDYLETI